MKIIKINISIIGVGLMKLNEIFVFKQNNWNNIIKLSYLSNNINLFKIYKT